MKDTRTDGGHLEVPSIHRRLYTIAPNNIGSHGAPMFYFRLFLFSFCWISERTNLNARSRFLGLHFASGPLTGRARGALVGTGRICASTATDVLHEGLVGQFWWFS